MSVIKTFHQPYKILESWLTETADNYADENSTVAERTGLHVETYINSDIMINLVISYLILREDFNKKKTVKRVTLSLLGLEPTYPT